MQCAICGNRQTEGAHVKPHVSFSDEEDDRYRNIIRLCPNHHEAFDDGMIGIVPDKRAFIIFDGKQGSKIESCTNIHFLLDEYVEERNESCRFEVRFCLGMIPGMEYGRMESP